MTQVLPRSPTQPLDYPSSFSEAVVGFILTRFHLYLISSFAKEDS